MISCFLMFPSSYYYYPFLTKSFRPVKSTATTGSFPTTHALCPGGITRASPGPNSSSFPSSIMTFIRPDIIYWVCGAWQLFVLTSGFTHFSQLHPGSNVALPIVTSPSFASSILPFSNVRVSSGDESKLFLCIFANCFCQKYYCCYCAYKKFFFILS